MINIYFYLIIKYLISHILLSFYLSYFFLKFHVEKKSIKYDEIEGVLISLAQNKKKLNIILYHESLEMIDWNIIS